MKGVLFKIPILIFVSMNMLYAQSSQSLLNKGNKAYLGGDYNEAQYYYEEAITKDIHHELPQAIFNLGNVFYQLRKYDEAATEYMKFINVIPANDLNAQAFYNLGNCYLAQKDYEQSISVFQESLKLNPKDGDARYNLTYAMAMLSKQEAEAEALTEIANDKKNAEQKQSEKKKQKKNMNNLTKEDLDQLLSALNESEAQTIDKLKQQPPGYKKVKKDW